MAVWSVAEKLDQRQEPAKSDDHGAKADRQIALGKLNRIFNTGNISLGRQFTTLSRGNFYGHPGKFGPVRGIEAGGKLEPDFGVAEEDG